MDDESVNKPNTARASKAACKANLRDALHDAATKRRMAKSAQKKLKSKEARLARLTKKVELLQTEVSKSRVSAEQAAVAATRAQELFEQRLAETRQAAEELRRMEVSTRKARKAAGGSVAKAPLKITKRADKAGGKQTRGCSGLA